MVGSFSCLWPRQLSVDTLRNDVRSTTLCPYLHHQDTYATERAVTIAILQ